MGLGRSVSFVSAGALLAGGAGAQVVLQTFSGAAGGDLGGFAVAVLRDANGDGLADFAVASPLASPGGVANAGEVRLFAGTNGARLGTFFGTTTGDNFGWSIADAGDVNGDGLSDLIVGIPGADAASLADAGQARVFSGANGAILHTLNGLAAGDAFGRAVGGAGLVDGDALADPIVGAPFAHPGNLANAGQARVFSGATGGVLHTLNGASVSDRLGWSVAGAGRVSLDAIDDFIVGAIGVANGTNAEAGQAVVYSGANGAVLHTFSGTLGADWFGWAVDGAGDVDGDGRDDLVVGARLANAGIFVDAGRARVFSGATGAILHTFSGAAAGFQLGAAVAGAGDLNVDGFDDVLVGAPYGGPGPAAGNPGRAFAFSGVDGSALAIYTGAALGNQLGAAVAGGGDANGDGFDDAFVGAPYADPATGGDAGTATAYSGAPAGVSTAGNGCAGSLGAIPRVGISGEPVTDSSVTIHLSGAPPATSAVLISSQTSASWGGTPLRLSLDFVGLPLCQLLVEPDGFHYATTGASGPGAGKASHAFDVPDDSSLVGQTAHFQWYVYDPGPGNLPGSMTRRLAALVLQ